MSWTNVQLRFGDALSVSCEQITSASSKTALDFYFQHHFCADITVGISHFQGVPFASVLKREEKRKHNESDRHLHLYLFLFSCFFEGGEGVSFL